MSSDTARSMKLSTRYCATIRDRDTMQQVRVPLRSYCQP